MLILVDRSRKEAALAIGVTWLLFCVAFVVEEKPDVADVILGGLLGGLLVVVGFAAASRCRPMAPRPMAQRGKLALLSLCAGIAVGAVILATLVGLPMDPGVRTQTVGRLADPLWQPFARAFGAAVVEEVVMRLAVMSVIAWIAARSVTRPDKAFLIALYSSALLFGLVHLPGLSLVGLTIVLTNGLGGLLLGWIFWRWGLPYAILCHFAGGVIIQYFGPRLLA